MADKVFKSNGTQFVEIRFCDLCKCPYTPLAHGIRENGHDICIKCLDMLTGPDTGHNKLMRFSAERLLGLKI